MEVERIIAIVFSHLMFILGLSELIQAKTWTRYTEEFLKSEHFAIILTLTWLPFGLARIFHEG